MEDNRPKSVALRGRLVTDYEVWPEGTVLIEGAAIREIGSDGSLAASADEVREYPDSLLVPGFVDLQVNGGFGVDIASEPERLPELSRSLLATGTTSYLPTVISSPEALYHEVLPELSLATPGSSNGAEVLGMHLEGPFLNAKKRGAHAASHITPPDIKLLGHLLELAPVRMMTIAPEMDGADELMALARGNGTVVSVGHSAAAFDVAYETFDWGAASVTHLFNAMSPIHHRAPGIAGAAFAHPRVACGLISDGLHVHPEVIGLAYKMLGPDRIYLVTDATAATGMEDGEYSLATRTIYMDAGVTRLANGSIAGSVLTMDEALQNILAFTGCTLPEAIRMTSSVPARLVGEGRRKGRLVPGFDADVTVLAPDLSVEEVWRAGSQVYSSQMAGG